jgi:hypothetical protein
MGYSIVVRFPAAFILLAINIGGWMNRPLTPPVSPRNLPGSV